MIKNKIGMITWLRDNFPESKPGTEISRKAVRHLKKNEKKQLFSDEISQMRAAEGRWYESLIYEQVLELSLKSPEIKYVVRKGADAPYPPVPIKPGQNGLFYSNRGDINIRGNGQDIAEVDLLIIDKNDQIGFAEIVTSSSDLKEFEEEVLYKKRLLGYLFGQITVPFILFSSVDISRSSIILRLTRETESVLIVTRTCEELKSSLNRSAIKGLARKPVIHKKLVDLVSLQPKRPFDYKRVHDLRRDKVMNAILSGEKIEQFNKKDEIPPLSKKILFGALYPSGIKALMKDLSFSVKDKIYTSENIRKDFTKIILAVDLPGYEPIIYLRSRHKKEYLKVVQKKSGGFRAESKRTPRMTGFFVWLESLEPVLGSRITRKYAESFMKSK